MKKFNKNLLCFLGIFSVTLVSNALAEPSNPSLRSLQRMARRGDPVVSIKALSDVCPTVKNVTGNEFLWKSQISNHINPGDRRATGPTFICNRVCPPSWPMNFYYSDGEKAAAVGYYGRFSGTGKPRAYCGAGGAPRCYINQINTKSKTSGRDGYVYLKTSSNTCYKVRPLGRTGRP